MQDSRDKNSTTNGEKLITVGSFLFLLVVGFSIIYGLYSIVGTFLTLAVLSAICVSVFWHDILYSIRNRRK